MNEQIDKITIMLSHFICADSEEDTNALSKHTIKQLATEIDAGVKLRFDPIKPHIAYTAQIGADREFALDSHLLLNTPQDLIGKMTEIALFDDACVKWSAFRKIGKRPRGIWVSSSGADLYEYHQRIIYTDGSSSYSKRVAAISRSGKPVRVIIEGTKNQSCYPPDGELLILAASIIEDSMRPGVFKACVKEQCGVILPVPQGEHLDVFRLRDGPMNGNRRMALLHWVSKHTRRTLFKETVVKKHLRGVHEFDIDGLNVRLDAGA